MTTKEPKHEKYGVKAAKNLEDAKLFAFALLIGGAGTIAAIIFELA
jgi:hypothetical protein